MKYAFGFLWWGFSVCLWFLGAVLWFLVCLFISLFCFVCLRVLVCFVLFSWKMQMLPSVKNAAQQIFQSLLSLGFLSDSLFPLFSLSY